MEEKVVSKAGRNAFRRMRRSAGEVKERKGLEKDEDTVLRLPPFARP